MTISDIDRAALLAPVERASRPEPVRLGDTFAQMQHRGLLPTPEEVESARFVAYVHPFTKCGWDEGAA